jgi:hypothetical protein
MLRKLSMGEAKTDEKKGGKFKKGGERVGDWTCQQCLNLNYSFRQSCNRCGLDQKESLESKSGSHSIFSGHGF